MRIGAWALRLAILLVVASGCHSCYRIHGFEGILAGHFKAAKGPEGGHYLAMRATKEGAGATIRPNRELWKPFRLEATIGLLDPAHAELGTGTFGISVLESSGIGAFYILEVKQAIGGIQVEAGTGGTPLGGLAIPDGKIADVAIASNGAFIDIYAKRRGDAQYSLLASAPAAADGPYRASLDLAGLPKGVVVGLALARLKSNGTRPSAGADAIARETVWTAIDALAETMYAMDAAAPDRTRAGDQLELAVARLDDVLATSVVALQGGAEKKLKSARKKASGLVAGVRGKKSAASAIKSLQQIVTLAAQAADPE